MPMTLASFRRLLVLSALACFTSLVATAQLPLVTPKVRVLSAVDNSKRTSLVGTHPAVVDGAKIGSRLAGDTQLQHMILVLKSTDEQEAVLHTLLDAQQDKNAPSFHKWLTPETFSASFGIAQPDLAHVTAWMRDSGLQVEQISKGGRFVTFSGSVSAVESAFQTEIHNVTVAGEAHISNITDITVPDAITPVIVGVSRLNNFFPKSHAVQGPIVQIQRPGSGSASANNSSVDPQYGSTTTGTHYVGPGDVAAIYNATPLYAAGIDGTGTTIAIIARSNINLADVATFRGLFGLPAKAPVVTVVGSDPGINGDGGEAYLDAEWAGAIATNATVNFIVSSASLIGEGIDTASLYAVDNNIGDIISMSYGGCETGNGASGTAFWNILWEQAAAQGQTAMVSTGDSGATGCSSSSATYGTAYGVNALGSSAYNVAVGGTMFVDYGPAQYWGTATAPPYATALGYIPEAAWNQGRLTTTNLNSTSTATVAGSGLLGTGGGVSIYTARPPWQTGDNIPATTDPAGIAAGSPITGLHRLVPDVALIAANSHDGTLFCAGGVCQVSTTGGLSNAGIVGGTSVATPVMASVQALIDQKNGGRQGNANYYYYTLAANQYSASPTACQSVNGTAAAPAVTLPASTCNFFDTVAGSNRVAQSSTDTVGLGFNAAAGYDEATGLGTPNIANLANNWKTVTFNATATTLAISPATGITHGAAQSATIAVTPASGTGTPTGDVSIVATTTITGATGNPQVFTLSAGSVSGAISGLPAGNYTVYAHYAGDGTFASSNSTPVTVSIAKEASSIALQPYLVTASGSVTPTTSFTYGSGEVYLDTEITGASATGTASGSVQYTINRNGSALAPLTTNLDTYGTTYFIAGPPYTSFYLLPNYATLPVGTYTITANYSGDGNFNANTAVANFTISPVTPTASFTTSTAQIVSAGNALLNFTITTPTSATPATGSVTFTDTTTSKVLGTATVTSGAAVLTTNLITTSGAHVISATYSGDSNFAPITPATTVTITVSANTAPTVVASTTSTSLFVGSTIALRATLGTAASAASSVGFYDNGVLLGTGTVTSGGTTASLSVTKFTAGTHPITAQFAGTSTQSAASGSFNLVVAKNTTGTLLSISPSTVFGSLILSSSISRNPTSSTAPVIGLTGTVTFYDGSTTGPVLGTVTNLNFDPGEYGYYSGGTTVTNVTAGNHTIVGVYSGDANYAASTSNIEPITIAQQAPGLTLTSPTISYGTASFLLSSQVAFTAGTAPTGAVTFSVDGGSPIAAVCAGTTSPLLCTATYTSTTLLSAGTHTLSASLAGDNNYLAATRSGTITVTKAVTTTILTTSVNNAPSAALVTFTATVSATGAPTPTGSVIFSSGSTTLATVALTNGVATFSTTALASTIASVTASYTGTVNFAASSSAVAVPATFTLTDSGLNSYSATVTQGFAAQTTVTLTPSATFSGTVTFTCTGLPTNATCTFTPTPLTVPTGGTVQSIGLLIRSATLTNTASIPPSSSTASRMALVFWLPGLLLAGIGSRSKRLRGTNRIVLLSLLMLGLIGTAGLTGCGGSSSHALYTITNAATGTSTVNVVATSPTYTQTLPVTFTIQ